MDSALLGIIIFFGILLGVIGALLLIKIKNNSLKRKLRKTFEEKGKGLDSIKKETEEEFIKKIHRKIEENKPKKKSKGGKKEWEKIKKKNLKKKNLKKKKKKKESKKK